ncbi:L-aspartate oxidase [Flammeovirga kamogawensis]|uniref:L-aspartate oxidase n=1 Tax=Flammeovirga kamogawensis TaxID=373891 RepID=A0ABX8GV45_9BACT|nr:L-aspartate oxidase [Flammeovirga kamogawensis]MBB6461668.1 L-aspartate oxidase [Flammeovirga kamogawensis]QWG07406.1 L-aspartate oxidase [Flammeovirga kamogawensis]TRX69218.1 L-aspartate oxidase [Flammeovirga kamogawensis]
MNKVDFLIVGSGIAGLSYALKLCEFYQKKKHHPKICLITKDEPFESNTRYAQGGIAAVIDADDSYEKHINDTLVAGSHINNEEVVKLVVENGPDRIRELINWGAQFDKSDDGDYKLAKEGGHSDHRILHFKDVTGQEIQRALLDTIKKYDNVEILQDYFAVDLITQHHLGEDVTRYRKDTQCYGVYALNKLSGEVETILSKVTLLATGGIGQVYNTTTNPSVATGDGIAMTYRAKGNVEHMEFVQFHPTALYERGNHGNAFLITEAMRGAGAILKNSKGEDFVKRYDKRGSLAPRDIVARAIDSEMKKEGKDHVWLDASEINKEELKSHFPSIYKKCLDKGIDITKDFIPVAPASHYLCGGIVVNTKAETSINNLLACGECTCTGLHGANRLASNSLLEAAVYAHEAFETSLKLIDKTDWATNIPEWNKDGTSVPEEMVLISQSRSDLQRVMSNYVGIVRSDERLARAFKRTGLIYDETEELYKKTVISQPLCELRNMITITYLIIGGAKNRHENIGLHYSIDYE